MTRRTEGLYRRCLDRINQRCQGVLGRLPQPVSVRSDYEVAILAALAACYPTATARGCYFHSGNVSGKVLHVLQI